MAVLLPVTTGIRFDLDYEPVIRVCRVGDAMVKAIIVIVLLLAGAGTLVLTQSTVSSEYLCNGEQKLMNSPPEPDSGRLRLNDYRWWVRFWSDSDGDAIFMSKKFAYFFSMKLRRTEEGNLAFYMSYDDGKTFLFRRATGELGVQENGQTFTGECIAAT